MLHGTQSSPTEQVRLPTGQPTYRQPVNINIQEAENGWIARVDGPAGSRFWVAKDLAGISALIETLSNDFEQVEFNF